jgi:hypothetical protein
MKKVLWMLPVLAAVCAAQSAETRQARGKRVVDEALQALGGQAFLHMQDRVESGRSYSFDNGKLAGTILTTIYTKYLTPVPGKVSMLEKDAYGKQDESTSGLLFTLEDAWDYTFHGARPMDDQRVANYKDSVLRNVFYILRQRLNEPGMSLYSQGADLWENRAVEIVDITDADNRTVTVYFSKNDKWPIRQTFRRRNPTYGDFDTEATLFAKYHESEGINWPMDVRRDRNGVKIYEMYTDSAEFNTDLKDSVFTLPSKLRVLPKEK